LLNNAILAVCRSAGSVAVPTSVAILRWDGAVPLIDTTVAHAEAAADMALQQ
jgi:hypothetical protein